MLLSHRPDFLGKKHRRYTGVVAKPFDFPPSGISKYGQVYQIWKNLIQDRWKGAELPVNFTSRLIEFGEILESFLVQIEVIYLCIYLILR